MLFKNNFLDEKITLSLGVINLRDERIETVEEITARAEEALEFLPPERIWLSPDCGFATFANRPLDSYQIIEEKLTSLVEASHQLRMRNIRSRQYNMPACSFADAYFTRK